MNNSIFPYFEQLGDVGSFREPNPFRTTWMSPDEGLQVVKLISDSP